MGWWWNRLWRRREKPLRLGASTGRRKTYSAESGYVYQYHLLGFRRTLSTGGHALEYIFEHSAGNRAHVRASVMLRESVLLAWATAHSRELSASERYALANMTLKRSFDSCPSPDLFPREIRPDIEDIEDIAAVLDL